MKTQNQYNKTGFALIEILAVLFIVGIIFSITMPAMGPMLSTLQLSTSAENLAQTLEAARQYAITSGEHCYVVFPTNTNNLTFDYRAYKIIRGKTPDYFTVGKWGFLLNTVAIAPDCSFITSPPNNAISIKFPEDTSGGQTSITHYIDFKPNGAATLNRTIRLIDKNDPINVFKKIVFYNKPIQINVRDIGET